VFITASRLSQNCPKTHQTGKVYAPGTPMNMPDLTFKQFLRQSGRPNSELPVRLAGP
jgi:hypothetical protein